MHVFDLWSKATCQQKAQGHGGFKPAASPPCCLCLLISGSLFFWVSGLEYEGGFPLSHTDFTGPRCLHSIPPVLPKVCVKACGCEGSWPEEAGLSQTAGSSEGTGEDADTLTESRSHRIPLPLHRFLQSCYRECTKTTRGLRVWNVIAVASRDL